MKLSSLSEVISNVKKIQNIIKDFLQHERKKFIITYIFYLCGIVDPILAFVLVSVFYCFDRLNSRSCSISFRGHYIFVRRTFVVLLVSLILSYVFWLVFVGLLMNIVIGFWLGLRGVMGLVYITKNIDHPNPNTFWIN